MRKDLLGILFPNMGDGFVREMTEIRCIGSVPFGARYRLIDFALSAMVNAGITKVGVTTRQNYRSLMDHLGSGKPWDLSRKKGGIYFFPPYTNSVGSSNSTRIGELASLLPFLEKSVEEYAVLSDCDFAGNIDLEAMAESHIKNGAQVTVAYTSGKKPRAGGERMVLKVDGGGRVTEILIDPEEEVCDYAINVVIMNRELLIKIVKDAISRNYSSLGRDILQRNLGNLKIYGWKFDGYIRVMDSMKNYLAFNLELTDREKRAALFDKSRPIFTKVADECPAKYGLDCKVKNSLIADGCIIDGEVENCVLFRGVTVEKGARLKNCVVMQGSHIGENAELSYVVTDKDVVISPTRLLAGFESYPAFIEKALLFRLREVEIYEGSFLYKRGGALCHDGRSRRRVGGSALGSSKSYGGLPCGHAPL